MEALLKPTPLIAPPPDRGAQAQALSLLTTGLEARIPWAAGHSRRVARYAAGLAKQMDLGREQITRVRWAAALHDIGKLEMPARIVNKPGPLSELEFAMVRRHAAIGARIVSRLGDEELAAIVRHHHERIDGTGYPDGLAGEEIPFGARIVAVADTFDALTSTRPYRPAKCHGEALDLLDAEAGTQLDPDVVGAFHRYCAGRRGLRLRMLAR
jgi:putative nucleotidyltransferase with HDIG domain